MTTLAGQPDCLHIAHVVLSLDPGGLERIVADLVRESRREQHRVSVLCLERAVRSPSKSKRSAPRR